MVLRSLKILVVLDAGARRLEALCDVLGEARGLSVERVTDPREVEGGLRRFEFDAACLGLSGDADVMALQVERTRKTLADVPLIVLTNEATAEVERTLRVAGATRILEIDETPMEKLAHELKHAVLRRTISDGRAEGLEPHPSTEPEDSERTPSLCSLRGRSSEVFEDLVTRYDRALRRFGHEDGENDPQATELGILSEHLLLLQASPRDLIQIHSTCMVRMSKKAGTSQVRLYESSGPRLLFDLMSRLAYDYRGLCLRRSNDAIEEVSPSSGTSR